jgi:hypothetical protein
MKRGHLIQVIRERGPHQIECICEVNANIDDAEGVAGMIASLPRLFRRLWLSFADTPSPTASGENNKPSAALPSEDTERLEFCLTGSDEVRIVQSIVGGDMRLRSRKQIDAARGKDSK